MSENSVGHRPFLIYCDGRNSSHSDRRWHFALFVRPQIAGMTLPWSEQFADGQSHASETIDDSDRHLSGEAETEFRERITRDRSAANVRVRRRFKFRCEICELIVECRYEHLESILDTLSRHGINELSLTGLAATLMMRGQA